MSSAYIGGKFDLIFQRVIDAYTCFPDLVLLITLMAIFGPGLLQILFVLGVSAGLQAVRQKRAIVFMIKENQYIHASETIGAGTWAIMMRHILPNILPLIITTFTLRMGAVIMAEASLSFLGLGLPPPMPSWGGMISGPGRVFMVRAPWMLFWPGLALTASIFGINMLGDALRDLLDPRLKGGTGSYRLDKAEKSRAKALRNLSAG
jgi:peptide/nickel transport system permease protein